MTKRLEILKNSLKKKEEAEEDVWVVRVYRERGKFYGESA